MGTSITLNGDRLAFSFPYDPELVGWVKGLGGMWDGKARVWYVGRVHFHRLLERCPDAYVAPDVVTQVEAIEEEQAMNMVRPLLNCGHKMHLDTATGRVWLEGEYVDQQPKWYAERLAPYAPALARIMRRQMAERVSTENGKTGACNGGADGL